MMRLCFVCTGNACRSPFAECVMKQLLATEGMKEVSVYSVGTLNWGSNPRDAEMCRVAQRMGYQMTGKTTVMTRESLADADLIVVFEEHHRNEITRVLDYKHWSKIHLFNRLVLGEDTPVEDPHFQSEAVYKRVALQIEEGCRQLVSRWKTEKG